LEYLQQLLKVGFSVIDCGSFVSHKAIPQMADTHKLIQQLERTSDDASLLTIVANERGANDAVQYEKIEYIGFPFSISETFQLRNTNSTIEESMGRVKNIQEICVSNNKKLLIYISMGFGNPYGDPWNAELVMSWVENLIDQGITRFALSDTIGVANKSSIKYLFKHLIPQYPQAEFAAHLHTTPHQWEEKVQAAYEAGCRKFDGAIKGFGGCPLAKDELTGNMPTEHMIKFFNKLGLLENYNLEEFEKSMELSLRVFDQSIHDY
jgi:hydroxymethylglutaryl-CoA lyase